MNQKITRAQLERFYKGHCTPQEHIQILEWIKSSGNEQAVHDFMKNHWERTETRETVPEPDFDLIFRRIEANSWQTTLNLSLSGQVIEAVLHQLYSSS